MNSNNHGGSRVSTHDARTYTHGGARVSTHDARTSAHGGARTSLNDRRKLPAEEQAALKQRILRLVDEGLPKLLIAQRLGVSPTTVHARLRDKTR